MGDKQKSWSEYEDLVAVKIPVELIEAQDNLTSTSKLIVTIDASTAGVVNGNQRLYRPDKVKAGAFSMIDKPFIKHHDEASDPIGVIIDADFKNIASDEFKATHRNFMSDKFWREDTPWDDIFSLSPQGLGRLVAKAQVTDLDAIEKILDRRFMGVSIKFRTDQMTCSCGKEKASMMSLFGFGPDEDEEEVCKHMPGESDSDGFKHFNVAGDLRFPHLSVVNEPADPNAKIITTDCIDMQIYDGFNNEKGHSKYILDTEGDDTDTTTTSPDGKDSTSQEGNSMDRTELLKDSTVKELLEEARQEGKDSRQEEVDELKAELESANDAIVRRDDLVDAAQDEVEGLTRTLTEELASRLVHLRAQRGDVDCIDNAEDMVAKFKSRTIASLRDSLEDERDITVEEPEEEVKDEPEADPDTKVDDPGVSPEGEDEIEEDVKPDVSINTYSEWLYERDSR
tara:strand:- start:1255 stop:2616 length:1362 start_codon:yes stop_codon:yes gene_type:complete